MRLPATRSRAIALVRHASLAAGLGLGWLLLSGAAASASGDPVAVPPPPAPSLSVPAATTAGQAGLAAVGAAQQASASAVTRTTTALASTARSAPSVVAPVLTAPLAPVAPIVETTTSAGARTLDVVGGEVARAVAGPVPLPGGIVLPIGQPAPPRVQAPTAAVVESPAPATAPEAAGPTAAPPEAVAFPVTARGPAPEGPAPEGSVSAIARALGGTQGGTAVAPSGPPEGQLPPPIPAAPASGASGSAGSPRGASSGAAILAGFELVPAFLVSRRSRTLRGRAPASRTFDPGSTPD